MRFINLKMTPMKMTLVIKLFMSALVGNALAFIIPVQELVFATIGIILVDTITGVLAAKHQEKALTSRKFSKIITKILVVVFGSLGARLMEVFILEIESMPILYTLIFAICAREIWSVLENVEVVFEIEVTMVIRRLLEKILPPYLVDLIPKDQEKETNPSPGEDEQPKS